MICKTDDKNPNKEIILACAEVIKNGGIAIFPTETVYGIGVNAFDESAVRRLYALKKRPADKPLLMHIRGREAAEQLGYLGCRARKLIELYTPGPLTLVVKKRPRVPACAVSGGETVGLRFPSNGIFTELAKAAGVPIAATSANFSGFESAKNASELASLASLADFVIDGGECEYSFESTILSLVGRPRILRQGAFPRERIEEVIGRCD
ncbi:MAG: threonylcarbamoyl-AMP synthase [Clostridia bacterium]|nr:threonylcarbamoyl-AMP synthase [Clostridia bacterium]